MERRQIRVRVDAAGQLEVVDPGLDSLGLLGGIDPGFIVHSSRRWPAVRLRLLALREAGCGMQADKLVKASTDELWDLHLSALERSRLGPLPAKNPHEASILDLKIELASRLLENCCLCALRCGVDRVCGERGRCGLGAEAIVADHFVHVAEESPINPSLVLNLAGCSLRCLFCQQWELLNPDRVQGKTLEPGLWNQLQTNGARTLSFAGGNPDESLVAILKFLNAAPQNWPRPIVWNCHAYASPETLFLLDGVVDCFVPDFKYGNDECGQRLSCVPRYPQVAKAAIAAMLAQRVPVIVRMLVLPGHVQCCHMPALRALARMSADNLFLSVRDQYCPDWQISAMDGELARRVSPSEIQLILSWAEKLGLHVVE